MPDKIKMYYSKLRNMGDCLNELIVKECFGYEAERHSFLDGEICGIGSCLGQYTLHGSAMASVSPLTVTSIRASRGKQPLGCFRG